MRCWPAGSTACKRMPYQRALKASTPAPARLHRLLRQRSRHVVDLDVVRGATISAGCRPARRRRRPLLGRQSPTATSSS